MRLVYYMTPSSFRFHLTKDHMDKNKNLIANSHIRIGVQVSLYLHFYTADIYQQNTQTYILTHTYSAKG